MDHESYSEWMSLYNTEMIGLWKDERKELKRITIIYHALQVEMDRVKKEIDKNLSGIRSELSACDALKGKGKEPLKEIDLNKIKPVIPKSPDPIKTIVPCDSPVLNKDGTRPKSVADNSNMYPPNIACTAQTTPKLPQKNITDDDITFIDCSIIETTPEMTKPTKKNSFLHLNKSKKSKPKLQNTLTQIFVEPIKKKKKWNLENIPADLEIDEILEIINQSSNESDENKSEEVPKPLASFVEGYDIVVDNKVEPEGVVIRGKERKKLKGWSCKECKEFYEKLDIPEEELQKKMDECSKHRGKYGQRDETYEGFWDLSFECTPQTQEEQSLIFNYKKL